MSRSLHSVPQQTRSDDWYEYDLSAVSRSTILESPKEHCMRFPISEQHNLGRTYFAPFPT